jgi:peptidoglycan/xylan/chitin deacetylase (PgdA/CDA1 family)
VKLQRRSEISKSLFTLMSFAAGFCLLTFACQQRDLFPGLRGPVGRSALPKEEPAHWSDFQGGSASRLAILLTDPNSGWLGLAQGLRSIGVPFTVTQNYRDAIRHRVVLVYPTISGKVLDPAALRALAGVPRRGGTLIGINVLGGGLNEVFGFSEAVESRNRVEMRFSPMHAIKWQLSDEREKQIFIGNRNQMQNNLGTCAYSQPRETAVASFEDGLAAITHRSIGQGQAYAFGLDLGAYFLKGYNNREEGLARSYVNDFEPAIDVLLRILRGIYREAEPDAVTLGTVPFGKSLALVITHDIDYAQSIDNALAYAALERRLGITATYFLQTKYIRDYDDQSFFNENEMPSIRRIADLGMEVASHSVSHSRAFNRFPIGTGEEQYPDYEPFVRNEGLTENGTVMGELRVSKYLIEKAAGSPIVVSFRPGQLRNPYSLPQAMIASGYRYSSSVTANNSLTHLPFQLTYNRETRSPVSLYEFPITVEDEALPMLSQRLPLAVALARKIAAYGGSFVLLIHTNITGDKLEFEKRLLDQIRGMSWVGSVAQFGSWWSARNEIGMDVESEDADQSVVRLELPKAMDGLVLDVPEGWALNEGLLGKVEAQQQRALVVLGPIQGQVRIHFKRGKPGPSGPSSSVVEGTGSSSKWDQASTRSASP